MKLFCSKEWDDFHVVFFVKGVFVFFGWYQASGSSGSSTESSVEEVCSPLPHELAMNLATIGLDASPVAPLELFPETQVYDFAGDQGAVAFNGLMTEGSEACAKFPSTNNMISFWQGVPQGDSQLISDDVLMDGLQHMGAASSSSKLAGVVAGYSDGESHVPGTLPLASVL